MKPKSPLQDFLESMRPAVEAYLDWATYVQMRRRLFRRSTYSHRRLPVDGLRLDRNTWEICVLVPGLLPSNRKTDSPMSLGDFYSQLSELQQQQPHCHLVFSDEQHVSPLEVEALADRPGHSYTGTDLSHLPDDEKLDLRLDLPPKEITLKLDRKSRSVTLLVKA